MELFHAHNQWSTRPADERFASIQQLHDACKAYARSARENKVSATAIRTEAINGDVQLVGRAGNPAKLTHWSFGQLAARISAPASYLRDLPATLACQNLNHGLAKLPSDYNANLLFHSNGTLLLRAFTSDEYSRIWNWEVAERLLTLEQQGWKPAVPTFSWSGGEVGICIQCSGRGIDLGTLEAGACGYCHGTGKVLPALYASDHDMFAFVVNDSAVISEAGNPSGLRRGVIVQNSEVGASALKLTRFLFRDICSNFIIWGASKVLEIKVRHIGNARDRWHGYNAELRRYIEQGAAQDEYKISEAKRCKIGDNKGEVLDKLFGMKSVLLSRKTIEAGYDAVNRDQDGDPNTVWGIVQGLTRHSQTLPHADARTAVDTAAGKLMEANF
jgi:hypothetical protein